MKVSVIGNLGSDAEVRNENGVKFVSLSIADTRRRRKENGEQVETTQWVSATINGDGGALLPYLKKGVRVYIYGDAELRQYHSEKERRLVAGIKVYVRDLDIVSVHRDEVPRDLYDADGVAHRVAKYYYTPDVNGVLYDKAGRCYNAVNGWVAAPDNGGDGYAGDNGANNAGASDASTDDAVSGVAADNNAPMRDANGRFTAKKNG